MQLFSLSRAPQQGEEGYQENGLARCCNTPCARQLADVGVTLSCFGVAAAALAIPYGTLAGSCFAGAVYVSHKRAFTGWWEPTLGQLTRTALVAAGLWTAAQACYDRTSSTLFGANACALTFAFTHLTRDCFPRREPVAEAGAGEAQV